MLRFSSLPNLATPFWDFQETQRVCWRVTNSITCSIGSAELEHMMSANPDPASYVKLSREYAGLEPLVLKIRALVKAEEDLKGAEDADRRSGHRP
jgi:protein subunit release factor A